MSDRARVVIVGGGIMGLATAYHLARAGVHDVVVLERSYLCGGASGRNGGGVRAQWSSETNIRLMRESIQMCRQFATEMGINVWFRQGGYLFLTRSEERARQLASSVDLQRDCGLPTRLVEPADIRRLVPEIDPSGIVVASFNPDDGVVFPWPFVWGYAKACAKLGVRIRTFTTVTAIEMRAGRIAEVVTDRGRIATEVVLNACGAWSPEVARMVGVELPNRPHRHEICSTEPLKAFLRPLVAELEIGLYFSQSMRGEIVGGISNDDVPPGLDQGSSMRFLGLYSKALTRVLPALGPVKVLRQWAGCYDLTPDGNPIVGEVDEVPGFHLACGFMGHGFMMAPVMGKLLAQHIVERTTLPLFDAWNLRRYRTGELLNETMIIG